MIVLHASGTKTTTVTTEHSLATAVVEGKFIFELDMNPMQAGDILEVRAYKIILASGTKRLMFYRMFCGVQPAHALIFSSDFFINDLADANSLEWSIKQTFGTTRDFPWKVLRETLCTTAAGALGFDRAIRAIGYGTVGGSASTTSVTTSAFSVSLADADQLKGRVLIFPGDSTGTGMPLQASVITASTTSATATFTVSPALTQAPASGATFIIQ